LAVIVILYKKRGVLQLFIEFGANQTGNCELSLSNLDADQTPYAICDPPDFS
jgi:hypothetical protein